VFGSVWSAGRFGTFGDTEFLEQVVGIGGWLIGDAGRRFRQWWVRRGGYVYTLELGEELFVGEFLRHVYDDL